MNAPALVMHAACRRESPPWTCDIGVPLSHVSRYRIPAKADACRKTAQSQAARLQSARSATASYVRSRTVALTWTTLLHPMAMITVAVALYNRNVWQKSPRET